MPGEGGGKSGGECLKGGFGEVAQRFGGKRGGFFNLRAKKGGGWEGRGKRGGKNGGKRGSEEEGLRGAGLAAWGNWGGKKLFVFGLRGRKARWWRIPTTKNRGVARGVFFFRWIGGRARGKRGGALWAGAGGEKKRGCGVGGWGRRGGTGVGRVRSGFFFPFFL